MNGVVYYQPVTRGLHNPDGVEPIRYFGKVYRIPASEHGSMRQIEWEMTPSELRGDITTADGATHASIDPAIIERFEVIDRESGDVWVMYRVPYQQVPGRDPAPC